MRCACIDIGTNTTRLLVGERDGGGLREVVAVRSFLRLAPAADGTIPPASVERVAQTVAGHADVARRHHALSVRAVATAAIRAAPNREALCRAVRAASGIPIDVLTVAEEAELAFAGAIATLADPPPGLLGVVDVGGGSSELVTGTASAGAAWWASFALGSGTLTDRHVAHDPPAPDELEAIRGAVDEALGGVRPPRPQAAYAVGGSATSLARVAGEELTRQTIARALALVTAEPAERAAQRLGVHTERARLLPAGLLLLDGASAAFGGAPLRIAGGGLREGVVLRELARL
jgi:exopolyphosphatase / guanosine-5'-triphosphate,3'-diphosphate pyrophosphatase